MASPLSSDLRERIVHAVEEGSSRRGAAWRFGGISSSAIRWQVSFAREGRVAAKPKGGDRRSQHVEAHVDPILSVYDAQPTMLLSKLPGLLAERGVATRESGLSGFFKRHGITRIEHGARSRAGPVRREG